MKNEYGSNTQRRLTANSLHATAEQNRNQPDSPPMQRMFTMVLTMPQAHVSGTT